MWTYNPFMPGKIVNPYMFSGRNDELKTLNRVLLQASNGNPFHFLIHGERGIGKSSLMLYMKMLATAKFQSMLGTTYNFIAVEVELSPNLTYDDILRKIASAFRKQVEAKGPIKAKATKALDVLKRLEGFGFKYNLAPPAESDGTDAVETLCDSFKTLLDGAGDDVDGILLLIDEADKPTVEANLGGLLKLMTERLSKLECNKVAVGLSGLSTVIEKLKGGHESSPRILSTMELGPLSHDECREVVKRGLDDVRLKSDREIGMLPQALEKIALYSEGFPHFLQQYAFSAVDTDTDGFIDENDVDYGANKEHGALDQLGVSYFQEMYSEQIDSDQYRKVLQVMSESQTEYVSRKDIARSTQMTTTTLTNALNALKKKRIIIPHTDKKGLYKLSSNSFGAWIRARVRRELERQAEKNARGDSIAGLFKPGTTPPPSLPKSSEPNETNS